MAISVDVCRCHTLSLLFRFGLHIITPTTLKEAGSAKIILKLHPAASLRSLHFSAQIIRSRPIMAVQCAHNSRLPTCTSNGKLISALGLGASYVHST